MTGSRGTEDGPAAGRRRDPARADGARNRPAGEPRDQVAHEGGHRRPDGGMQAARRAAQSVLDLTGHEPEHVVSLAREEDGWHIGVEVVELHRIPDTTDVLALYQVTLDPHGELVRCERERRYHRASTELEY
jgi:hypothetical protein